MYNFKGIIPGAEVVVAAAVDLVVVVSEILEEVTTEAMLEDMAADQVVMEITWDLETLEEAAEVMAVSFIIKISWLIKAHRSKVCTINPHENKYEGQSKF